MRLRAKLLAILALCGTAAPANAGMIANYTFAGNSAAATSADPGVTAGDFQDGDGSLDFSAGVGNPAPSVFKSYESLTNGSFSSTAWLGFSVTPLLGQSTSFTQLTFDAQRDQATPGNNTVFIEVRSSLDNFGTSSTLFSTLLTDNSGSWSVDLSTALSQVTSSTLSLRFYLRDVNNSSTSLGFHLDNVELYGTVGPSVDGVAPEPGSMALCAIGSGLAFFGQRLRRRRTA